ncbi:MAG: nucleoside triphosphate pyrophosphohydrolase [Hyphomonadaceae bacterium]
MTNHPDLPQTKAAFDQLVEIMDRLRDPETGCPWDIKQDFASIAPYTIEEAYEVLDAIQSGNMDDLRDELGDLLLQVVFHSQMAKEAGHFTIEDVARAINEKMIRRHPHVFAGASERDAESQTLAWEAQKAAERALKAKASGKPQKPTSALDGVALALPALTRSEKIQKRAARVGFDWDKTETIFDKLTEETGEVREAIASGDMDAVEDEIGDLLFVVSNLARHLKIDPEQALRRANGKFERRFRAMEAEAIGDDVEFASLPIDEQEAYWQRVKAKES